MLDGFIRLSLKKEGASQIIVGFRVIRFYPYSLPEMVNGFNRPFQGYEDIAEIEVCLRGIRFQAEGFFEIGNGLFQFSFFG